MNTIKGCRYGMMIYNSLDIWQGKSFQMYGEFSEAECDLFRKVIKPGDVVLDVGANIGSHTVCFARLVGRTGIVVAFEPERTAFYTLCGNVSVNSFRHVFCFQQAIGNDVGVIQVPEMGDKVDNWGGIELEKEHAGLTYPVPLNMLDKVSVPNVSFIKIDVEGMELKVLMGAKETIEKYRPYLYVENDRPDKIYEVNKLIQSLGYEIYKHDPPLFNPNNFNGVSENVFLNDSGGQYVSGNIFCVPIEKQIPYPLDGLGLQKVIISSEVDLDNVAMLKKVGE